MEIISINNPKVKNWAKLKEKKYRDKERAFIIEGEHLVCEAIKRGVVKEIIATDSSFEIPNIPFYQVSDNIMKKISSQVSSTNVIAICQKLESKDVEGSVCLLDHLQDPGNLGTIIRSAVAFNIKTIIMSYDTVDLYNEKVIRASEGMIFHLNFLRGDLNEKIAQLKEDNYTIYGTDVQNGHNLLKVKFDAKSAIIIGNEGNGMNETLKSKCDKLIHIPISSNCESLNAGVAASIIFYTMGK